MQFCRLLFRRYVLSPELEKYEEAQRKTVVLGMPIISEGIAAA